MNKKSDNHNNVKGKLMRIEQFPDFSDKLDSFLELKQEKSECRGPAYRFFRYVFRPIRFLIRCLALMIFWISKKISHFFHILLLIPEEYVPNDKKIGKVMLIKGDWGVGKTFLVEDYFKTNAEANFRYKPVFIDLFGISSIDELNKKVAKSISFSKKNQKEKSIKIYAKATIENKLVGLSASFELGVILSKKIEKIRNYNLFVERENNIYKKRKYRYLKEPVIILDDIERKNKELSLETIIGFVDTFKKQGIKVILIANAVQLEINEKEMYHLLDRAVDQTVNIYNINSSIYFLSNIFKLLIKE